MTFVTNDGDTARIVGAGMGQAWPSAKRGSLPVAWALDFAMAPQFPALFDFFVGTARQNDTFIAALAVRPSVGSLTGGARDPIVP